MHSTVSVIIPVYNAEKYIRRCLLSVMRQSYRDLEILVIDDGSTDGTGPILERLTRNDPRVRLVHQDNRGVAAARNRGLAMASGRYVTFIDGDDYISRTYIEKFAERAKETRVQMLIGGIAYVDEHGRILKKLVPDRYERFVHEEWCQKISGVWAHFYERSLWEESGMRFVSGARGEDLPVSLYFSAACSKIEILPVAGYAYVQHADSAMHHFRGLADYQLPYRALEESIRKVFEEGVANSEDFFELFILRILATFLFSLAPGAGKEKTEELCDYIEKITAQYIPDYTKNPLIKMRSHTDFPLNQKAAVRLLIRLIETGTLRPVSHLIGSMR